MFLSLMVEALERDTERSFAKELLDLIPISDVISHDNFVVTFVIIIAEIVFTLQ